MARRMKENVNGTLPLIKAEELRRPNPRASMEPEATHRHPACLNKFLRYNPSSTSPAQGSRHFHALINSPTIFIALDIPNNENFAICVSPDNSWNSNETLRPLIIPLRTEPVMLNGTIQPLSSQDR